ncbi:hypothetical protein BABINDRAFT_110395 [Babjeviella inositovora NRRL Y-12698]|uniref:Uncharacterized protein n=1 Tax=Babjeviella inositovora NRRL Y-12698 TaxID=984486 RepID=A0A1E3QVM3_9ASCO|nr:uncharacterized protein BABINDRAFT_110395 [Babjeviella inositovora NRRL Y-12698]ODQ81708.1 hypothetical protein BABINDRAFT_110395 [Babjeviella inositovora NRRL Y-12698]
MRFQAQLVTSSSYQDLESWKKHSLEEQRRTIARLSLSCILDAQTELLSCGSQPLTAIVLETLLT